MIEAQPIGTPKPTRKRRTAAEHKAMYVALLAALDSRENNKTKKRLGHIAAQVEAIRLSSADKPWVKHLATARQALLQAEGEIKTEPILHT